MEQGPLESMVPPLMEVELVGPEEDSQGEEKPDRNPPSFHIEPGVLTSLLCCRANWAGLGVWLSQAVVAMAERGREEGVAITEAVLSFVSPPPAEVERLGAVGQPCPSLLPAASSLFSAS